MQFDHIQKAVMFLTKMKVRLDNPVAYTLVSDAETIDMNALIGKQVKLTFTGATQCTACLKSKKYLPKGCATIVF